MIPGVFLCLDYDGIRILPLILARALFKYRQYLF